MSYSYFGWEDEFKGLTKDTNFSGSAAEEDSKPQGLGSKAKSSTKLLKEKILKD